MRTSIAAVVGGTASEIGGGKFSNGAVSGAFVHMFNAEAKSTIMKVAEFFRGSDTKELISSYALTIDGVAKYFGIDAKLMKAIIYEEQTHLDPFFESLRESLGMGNTVGLGQITVGYYGFSREQLLDPVTNIYAIGKHISMLNGSSMAMIATQYNCGSCSTVSNYGRRVSEYYKRHRGIGVR